MYMVSYDTIRKDMPYLQSLLSSWLLFPCCFFPTHGPSYHAICHRPSVTAVRRRPCGVLPARLQDCEKHSGLPRGRLVLRGTAWYGEEGVTVCHVARGGRESPFSGPARMIVSANWRAIDPNSWREDPLQLLHPNRTKKNDTNRKKHKDHTNL